VLGAVVVGHGDGLAVSQRQLIVVVVSVYKSSRVTYLVNTSPGWDFVSTGRMTKRERCRCGPLIEAEQYDTHMPTSLLLRPVHRCKPPIVDCDTVFAGDLVAVRQPKISPPTHTESPSHY
jgi:hypothetical protein